MPAGYVEKYRKDTHKKKKKTGETSLAHLGALLRRAWKSAGNEVNSGAERIAISLRPGVSLYFIYVPSRLREMLHVLRAIRLHNTARGGTKGMPCSLSLSLIFVR